jgi:hypothetical protein
MRRWAIALALVAGFAFPSASLADDAMEGEGGAATRIDSADATRIDPADATRIDPAADGGEEDAEEAEEPEPEEEAQVEDEEDEEEPSDWDYYLMSVGERFLTGLNGIVTAPADPPMAAIDPPKALEKAGYARYPLGFASGILLMGYRTLTGAVDFALCLVPKMPVLSPVPRYQVIPGFEHEDA